MVSLKRWARQQGAHPVTAYRWFRESELPVLARRADRLILVDAPAVACAGTVAVYSGCLRLIAGPAGDQSVTTIVVEHRDRFARFRC